MSWPRRRPKIPNPAKGRLEWGTQVRTVSYGYGFVVNQPSYYDGITAAWWVGRQDVAWIKLIGYPQYDPVPYILDQLEVIPHD